MNVQTTTFAALSAVKSGDLFTLRGYEYKATGDAQLTGSGVYIPSVRKNGAMPSGWELADVFEFGDR